MPPPTGQKSRASVLIKKSVITCPSCHKTVPVMTINLVISSGDQKRGKSVGLCMTCWSQFLNDLDHNTSVTCAEEEVKLDDVIKFDRGRIRHAARARVKRSQKRELEAAKDIGGKKVSQSGAGVCKGDARNNRWMVEDKGTSKRTFTLSNAVISKAVTQAAQTGRKAVIRVGLGDRTELAITRWVDFMEVICEEPEEDS